MTVTPMAFATFTGSFSVSASSQLGSVKTFSLPQCGHLHFFYVMLNFWESFGANRPSSVMIRAVSVSFLL